MKSVLISTRPKLVEKICHKIGEDETGKAIYEKRIEVRKSAPQEVPFKCYIYETQGRTETPWIDEDGHFIYKGRGQVIGEFICDKVERLEEHIEQGGLYYTLSYTFNEQAQLDNWELHDYGKGKTLYGWHISDLKIYDKPKELWNFVHRKKYDWWDYGHCTNKPQYEWEYISRPPQSWQYVKEREE